MYMYKRKRKGAGYSYGDAKYINNDLTRRKKKKEISKNRRSAPTFPREVKRIAPQMTTLSKKWALLGTMRTR